MDHPNDTGVKERRCLMVTKYLFQGEEFEVDDSKGCYLEISYKGEVGYVGVWVNGTEQGPYGFSTGANTVSDKGLTGGNVGIPTIESALNSLCGVLLSNYRQTEGRKSFKPDEACEALHDFVQKL